MACTTMDMALKQQHAISRILARCKVNAQGCWMWQGAKTKQGTPTMRWPDGRSSNKYVRRVAYDAKFGPIAPGFTISATCRQEGCVNPDHHEPLPPGEAQRRGQRRRWRS